MIDSSSTTSISVLPITYSYLIILTDPYNIIAFHSGKKRVYRHRDCSVRKYQMSHSTTARQKTVAIILVSKW